MTPEMGRAHPECVEKASKANRSWRRRNRKKFRAMQAAIEAKRRERAVAAGKCIACGEAKRTKGPRCAPCVRIASDRNRARKAAAIALAVALGACAARPAAVEPVRHETPYCFRLTFAFSGHDEAGLACGASAKLCESARDRAMKWGAAAGIREAGECKEER